MRKPQLGFAALTALALIVLVPSSGRADNADKVIEAACRGHIRDLRKESAAEAEVGISYMEGALAVGEPNDAVEAAKAFIGRLNSDRSLKKEFKVLQDLTSQAASSSEVSAAVDELLFKQRNRVLSLAGTRASTGLWNVFGSFEIDRALIGDRLVVRTQVCRDTYPTSENWEVCVHVTWNPLSSQITSDLRFKGQVVMKYGKLNSAVAIRSNKNALRKVIYDLSVSSLPQACQKPVVLPPAKADSPIASDKSEKSATEEPVASETPPAVEATPAQ